MTSDTDRHSTTRRSRLPYWAGYLITALAIAAVTALSVALQPALPLGHYPVLYGIVSLAAAYWFGAGPAALSIILGFIAFDYYFIPPLHTVWPPATTRSGQAAYLAFLIGTILVSVILLQIGKSRRRIEQLAQDLVEGDHKFRSVFDNAGDAIFIADTDALIIQANQVAVDRLGYSYEELLKMTVMEIDTPEAAELVEGRMADLLRTGRSVFESCHLTKDGRTIPVEVSNRVIEYEGRPCILAVARDITERKEAEEELLAGRERVRALSEAAFEGIAVLEAERVIDVNDQMAQLLGYSPDEMIGHNAPDLLVVPEDRERVRTRIVAGIGELDEQTLLRKDGSRITVETRAKMVSYQGRAVRVSAFRDITEHKRAEQELRDSQWRLSRSQAIAHLGSWELDIVANRLMWSDEVYRIFGLEPREFGATYEAFMEAVHPDDRKAVDEAYKDSLREGRDTYEIEHRVVRMSDGGVRVVHERCEHIRDSSGRIVRSVGMVHDVTERKRAEEAVRRQLSLLQQALVPPKPFSDESCAVSAVYVPAYPGEQIGGDFYDVFRTESGKIAVVIGDVAGKGIEAAALAAAARSTVRAFAYELTTPGAALDHTNTVLVAQDAEQMRFVTMFLVMIDASTGAFAYAGAGHPPPAVRRADGSVEFLATSDAAAGLFAEVGYATFEGRLGAGDTIILYTDGVLEARRDHEYFEQEGIERALSSEEHGSADLASGLLDAAREWTSDNLRDDIAILAVQLTKGASS